MVLVLMSSLAGFTALYFWLHNLQCRIAELAERRASLEGDRP